MTRHRGHHGVLRRASTRLPLMGATALALTALVTSSMVTSASADGTIPIPTPTPTTTPTTASTAVVDDLPADLFAGLGPIPTDPAKAVAYRNELRKRITIAGERRKAADEALSEVKAEAAQASHAALAAEQRASDARDRLTLWTAYLYRVSGNAGMLSILNDPKADPAEFLRGTSDAVAFSESFIRDVQEAHDAAVEAQNASASAIALQQAAVDRTADAEAARQFLVDLLGPAQELTQPAAAAQVVSATPALAGMSGPQTIVDGSACPTTAPSNTLRDGSDDLGIAKLCRQAVASAATPQAALAIQAAFQMLGAPYACGGVGRQDAFRFDCSSLVSRAYYLGAGLDTAGATWAPSTRDMVPWDGVPLAWWASYVDPKNVRPGDIVLYDTGGAAYRHVVMYIGNGYMLHTNSCGDVAHISSFWGYENGGRHAFLVARRVIAPGGYRVPDPRPIPTSGPTANPSPADPGVGDPKVNVPTIPTKPKPTPNPTPSAPTTTSPAPTPTDTPTPTPTPTSSAPTNSPPTTSSPTPTPTSTPTSASPTTSMSGVPTVTPSP